MKRLIVTLLLVVSLGACENAPQDYITQADLDEAMSQCVTQDELDDYVLQYQLEDYVSVSRIEFLEKQIYDNHNKIISNNTNTFINIYSLRYKIDALERE
jgi:uncharacterized lipoprotein YehR (DUF1307 family)